MAGWILALMFVVVGWTLVQQYLRDVFTPRKRPGGRPYAAPPSVGRVLREQFRKQYAGWQGKSAPQISEYVPAAENGLHHFVFMGFAQGSAGDTRCESCHQRVEVAEAECPGPPPALLVDWHRNREPDDGS